jgi:hypothetical protein
MNIPRRRSAVLWCVSLAIWLCLGLSLGWYYTITYYGRVGWPMPTPEPCAALILYYFSVLNVSTELQAVHWMLVFPIVGILWALVLRATARFFGGIKSSLGESAYRFGLATLPFALPIPWMTYLAGQTEAGFSIHRMLDVALRHGFVSPWPSLNPMYFALGLVSLALEIRAYRACYSPRGARAWKHFLSAAIVLLVGVAVLGAFLAVPLRAGLE